MPDLGTLLREHYESIAPPIDVDAMTDRLVSDESAPRGLVRLNGLMVSVAAALVVLFVVGGIALLIRMNTSADVPVVENPTTTTTAQEESFPDAVPPPIENAPASAVDVGLPFTVLDREGDVGEGITVFVGADGIPHIAYIRTTQQEGAPTEIRVATCSDSACTSAGIAVTIAETLPPESGRRMVRNVAAIVPADALPLVAWIEFDETEDGGDTALRVYKCADTSCSGGSVSEVGAAESWSQLEIALGVDDLPVLAFSAQESIHLVVCSDAACEGPVDTSVLDFQGLNTPMAMAVGEDGLPVLAFGRFIGDGEPAASLTVARCTDTRCADAPVVVDTGIAGHGVEGMGLDANGNPVMVIASPGSEGHESGSLMLVACTDLGCADAPVVTSLFELALDGEFGSFGSMDVAADGSVTVLYVSGVVTVITCGDPACADGPVIVDVLPSSGYRDTDIALGQSGNPVIGIYASTDAGVFVCSDRTCGASKVEPLSSLPDSAWAATRVAPADVQFDGANPSIDIGVDGNPVVAYLGRSGERGPEGEPVAVPKLLLCEDAACTSSATVQLDDDGTFPVLAIGTDGVPVVAYSKWVDEGAELLFAWCADTDCSTWTTDKITMGWLASPAALALRPDGSLVAVYQDLDDYYVYIVNCAEGTCSDTTPIRVDSLIDDNGTEWGQRWWMNNVAVALLPDGRPVIAAAQMNGELRYVECADAPCSKSTMTVIGEPTLDSVTVDLVVGSHGLPLMAYYNDGTLTMAACEDTACSDVTLTDLGVATASWVSSVTPSLVIGPDGLPMVAYWAPRSLMLAQCRDITCSESSVEPFADVRTYDLAVLADGSPVLSYFVFSEDQQETGEEHFQRPVDLWLSLCIDGACGAG
jgi:hypothetical protein